ncbi:ABC transporter ATP-binding protein [Pseudoroseomonas cervicalis]|uniref:ABC transporter ATP-binding protein n=1 Tax=Teichococcus cervicalis TaxID=204525 RepID=UPI0022F1680C|nr:ABC transporter ATP-binding protein [Pseudoroseomonas cervicalis]WBV45218.1 ABC transporter ATP-binding protein [Pseudoroseomonas cervicalis]
MLALEGVEIRYGGLVALRDVSLQVQQGEVVAVIGPNGAGKTTLFKAISGVVPLAAGRITLEGEPLDRLPPAERPHRGIAHVPEGRQVFSDLSVEENLLLGTIALRDRASAGRSLERCYDLFPVLRDRRSQLAGSLSGGQQQMLAIGRGIASEPRLLMLDEPSMGLAPTIVDTIFEAVQRLNREAGLTVLIVEQRAIEAIEACDRGYVLSTGQVVMRGTRAELLADKGLREAYLGA